MCEIIFSFPLSGAHDFRNKNPEKAIVINLNDYSISQRKRNKEELETIKANWEKTPHLLSGEGYINKVKDEVINVPNPDYPENMVSVINKSMQEFDYIFFNSGIDFVSTFDFFHTLIRENIKFKVVIPKSDMICEWIGRDCIHKVDTFHINYWKAFFRNDIDSISNFCNTHNIPIIFLNRGEYLTDIF